MFTSPISGEVTEINRGEKRKILEVKFRLGLFENPFVDIKASKDILMKKEHQDLALETARKSIVLVKNKEKFLPISGTKYKKILVTGPNANNQSLCGDWSSLQPDDNVITPYEGIKMAAPKGVEVNFFNSGEIIGKINQKNIKATVAEAKKHDLVVMVIGENSMRYDWKNKTNGENKGRANIDLSGKQLSLVKEVHATGTPVVVVLVSGRPLATPWISWKIPAVLNAWEPGAFGGQAIGEILFGQVNPSGKLPITIPRSVGQLQMIYNHKPSQYFHKYLVEKQKPLYPFGFGLSYSWFNYSNLEISKSEISKTGTTTVSVDVKNVSKRDGDEIVQMYIRDDYASVGRYLKMLKGFERITLKPGETKTVTFELNFENLSILNQEMKKVVESGDFTISIGTSSLEKDLKKVTLTVN